MFDLPIFVGIGQTLTPLVSAFMLIGSQTLKTGKTMKIKPPCYFPIYSRKISCFPTNLAS